MATKKTKKDKYVQGADAAKDSRKGKSFKAEQLPLAQLDEGDTLVGTFQGRKQMNVMNPKTKERNDVWFYRFRDKNGTGFAVSGRTMLDQAFDDAAEQMGGIDELVGLDLRINRGDDVETGAGNTMGSYELVVLED